MSLTLPDSVPLTPAPSMRTPRPNPAPPSVDPVAATTARSMEVTERSVRGPAQKELRE